MPTIEKPIIQHTPLLNFQAGYAGNGASLRATELKPKLDRFIIENYIGKIKPEWFVGKTKALDYKLKIVGGKGRIVSNGSLPMYFGQRNDIKPTMAEYYDNAPNNQAVLQFFCLHAGLADILNNLDYFSFFLSANFGTRQSKGYGSFFPDIDKIEPEKLIGKIIKTERRVSYRVDSYFSPDFGKDTATWKDIMDCISDVYKCFRSGINEGGLYFKSLMFAYAKSEGEWWDKRIIKELFYPNKLEEQREKHPNRTDPDPLGEDPTLTRKKLYPMFRDNLGLSTFEYWRHYDMRVNRSSKDVKRFKSPILFKPVQIGGKWYVFLLHREIPQKLRDTEFSVKIGRDSIIRTKTFEGFTMDDYMNFIMGIEDYGNYVKTHDELAKNRSNGILNDLDELKENYKKIE